MDRETMRHVPPTAAPKDASAEAVEGRRNLVLLTICQFLYYMGMGVDLTLTAVVGLQLAPTPVLATLPLTIMGTAAMVANFSAGLLSNRFGHRRVAAGGAATAVAGGLVSMFGIRSGDFTTLCLGTGLVGLYKATGGYFRYLAADSVPKARRERAVSVLLCGGVLAAFVGPWAAEACAGLLDTEYAGSYLLVSVLAVAVIPPVLAVRDRPTDEEQPPPPPVRVRTAARTREFRTAFAVLTVAGCVMTLLMSAGPLGSRHAGHPDSAGAFIIQVHMVGMFAPSFFSGWLNTVLGPRRNAVLGSALLAAGALVGAVHSGVAAFVVALALIGVGWNFLYVAGSTFVVRCYPPHAGGRVQATVEGGTGVFITASSFVSGYLFTALGWQVLSTLAALLPLLLCLWLSAARRDPEPSDRSG
ncbi:hypothetical protein ADK41_30950 [Streptomyces caelestis]|uniref:Major facilitator superfamily (MFS) profile domain-containing protein n=1 Tax=Streptomyces caelestis TaxID=36816 RepID=A0A0M8QKH6_9ACTN|nr:MULTISPECIES: MFS transporter [Streptomyces]KOT31426.1 hypothetical protein ADK41_30950 [Streptomyces caelestis]